MTAESRFRVLPYGTDDAQAETLAAHGRLLKPVALPPAIRAHVVARDWPALDRAISQETRAGGAIFETLRPHAAFTEIEFIISIRSSLEYADEDGIWHDDGSRVLAFSLSLTLDPGLIEGGCLEMRRRDTGAALGSPIATPPYATMIVFATGHQGFEHKINHVAAGERIIIAGWCT